MRLYFPSACCALLFAAACPGQTYDDLSEPTRVAMDALEKERERAWAKVALPADELQGKLVVALEKLAADAKAAGNVRRAAAAEVVLVELAEGETPDGESVDADVAKAEKVFVEHFDKLKPQIRAGMIRCDEEHAARLESLADRLDGEGLSSDASVVSAIAESLAVEIQEMKDLINPAFKDGKRPGAMPASAVKIIEATFGHPGNSLDVTDKIQSYVDSRSEFQVNVKDMGGDPEPYRNKPLKVIYEKDGKRHEQNRGENEIVLFESFAGPHSVKEMKAWLIGTQWELDGDTYEFQEDGVLKSPNGKGEWKADELFFVKLKLDDKSFVLFRMDWLWKKLTEDRTKDRVLVRMEAE